MGLGQEGRVWHASAPPSCHGTRLMYMIVDVVRNQDTLEATARAATADGGGGAGGAQQHPLPLGSGDGTQASSSQASTAAQPHPTHGTLEVTVSVPARVSRAARGAQAV